MLFPSLLARKRIDAVPQRQQRLVYIRPFLQPYACVLRFRGPFRAGQVDHADFAFSHVGICWFISVTRLDYNWQNGMGAGRMSICGRGFLSPALIPIEKQFQHVVRWSNDDLSQAKYHNSLIFIFSHLKPAHRYLLRQQIPNNLIVNLQVTQLHLKLLLRLLILNPLKNLIKSQNHDSWIRAISQHRICLASPRSSISKHRRIISADHAFHQWLSRTLKHLLLASELIEHLIKAELLNAPFLNAHNL